MAVIIPVGMGIAIAVLVAFRPAVSVIVSVTGLAGPGGDEFGNPVGTVFIGYCDEKICLSRKYLFSGSREEIRTAAIREALRLVLDQNG